MDSMYLATIPDAKANLEWKTELVTRCPGMSPSLTLGSACPAYFNKALLRVEAAILQNKGPVYGIIIIYKNVPSPTPCVLLENKHFLLGVRGVSDKRTKDIPKRR